MLPGPINTPLPSLAEKFVEIDQALKESLTASIAYNPPAAMKLGQTVTIELLLNPAVEPDALATQITEGDQPITASIQITPRMKAVLISQEEDTFLIRPMHDNPEQLISPTETTKWIWDVTATKGGQHRLTLLINRLITVDGKDDWRLVEAYRSDIDVDVTATQRLSMLDWKWIAGIIATALLILSFWLWMDQRNKKSKERSSLHATPKLGSVSANTGHAFISYRRSDSADIVGRIYDRLAEDFGEEPIFKDVDDIPLGVDFKEYLDQKVSECTVLLAVIGDRWVNANDDSGKKRLDDPNDFVRIEIEAALARDIPVIPLLVRGASMPAAADLPPSLQKLVYKNGIPIRPDPDFHHDMDRLISALESLVR